MKDIVGTQCGDGSDGEADAEIEDEGHADSGDGEVEPVMTKRGDAIAGCGQCQHAAVQGDVAHVERQAEEAGDFREKAQHVAEDDAGAPGGDVVLKPAGKTLHMAHANFQSKGMLGDGGGDAVVDGEVLAPSAYDGGGPEQDSGDGGVDAGARGKRVQRLVDMLGCLLRKVGVQEHAVPQLLERNGAEAYGNHVADGGGKLCAADAGGEVGDLAPAGDATVFAHDAGEGSGGHGWLLGSEGETEDLQQDEADGVVGADEEAFDEERPFVLDDAQLEGRGKDSEQAAPERGEPHLPVFSAGVGDVV